MNRESNIDRQFELSCKLIKTLKKTPSDNDMLKLYGLYKQATCGDCNISEPSKIYFKDNSKWNAWNKLKGVKKLEAKLQYSNLAMKLIETIGIK